MNRLLLLDLPDDPWLRGEQHGLTLRDAIRENFGRPGGQYLVLTGDGPTRPYRDARDLLAFARQMKLLSPGISSASMA